MATAAETGVYGPEGEWLIEGHGVDPDIVVDNLPHETFKGRDAQLEAAVKHLKELLARDPRPVPPHAEVPGQVVPALSACPNHRRVTRKYNAAGHTASVRRRRTPVRPSGPATTSGRTTHGPFTQSALHSMP